MKKLLNLLLLAAVMTALSVPAMAAESGIRVADVTVQETDLVSIPVALQTETTGTAMSLTYTYDSAVLEIVPEDCRWIPSGAIRDFSKTGPQAVWASSGEKKLSGDLCVLTFRILNRETFRKTEVSCSVTVKNGGETVGSYTDSAKITRICAHDFGEWTSGGTSAHSRKCALCGQEELQSHDWDQGTISRDPENTDVVVTTYRCTVCAEERIWETPGAHVEIRPTHPEESESPEPAETKPQPTYPGEVEKQPTRPAEQSPESQKPSSEGSWNSGSGTPGQNGSGAQPHDYNRHSQMQADGETLQNAESAAENGFMAEGSGAPEGAETTRPIAIKVEESPETAEIVHAFTESSGSEDTSRLLRYAVAAALTVLAAAAVYLLLRKKRCG